MAEKDEKAKDGKEGKDAKPGPGESDIVMTDALKVELDALSGTQRAAVLMLLLGEQEAAKIISYLNPKEVQPLGAAMVSVADLSQEAISAVLDEFIATIKKQTNLALGVTDYVETVLKRALGDDKAASVLGRILPGNSSKGLEILRWMDARSIADMIRGEHPQIVAAILVHLEHEQAAAVLMQLPERFRSEVMLRVATLEGIQPTALKDLNEVLFQVLRQLGRAQAFFF